MKSVLFVSFVCFDFLLICAYLFSAFSLSSFYSLFSLSLFSLHFCHLQLFDVFNAMKKMAFIILSLCFNLFMSAEGF